MGRGWWVSRLASAALVAAVGLASPAVAEAPPTPGMEVDDESGRCTAGFAAQGNDGNYYMLTSGHCDAHDGSDWTYGSDDTLLGTISASEVNGDKRDAAIIRLDPDAGTPNSDVGGRYQVRDVLGASQLHAGMPFCKVGAVTGRRAARSRASRVTSSRPASTASKGTAAVRVSSRTPTAPSARSAS